MRVIGCLTEMLNESFYVQVLLRHAPLFQRERFHFFRHVGIAARVHDAFGDIRDEVGDQRLHAAAVAGPRIAAARERGVEREAFVRA